jgi:hypothetical protein
MSMGIVNDCKRWARTFSEKETKIAAIKKKKKKK